MNLTCRIGMIAGLTLVIHAIAGAQTVTANQLVLHNGGEYYANGPFYGFPNGGAGRYFPSFAHWASTPASKGHYPLKIAGWCWDGMQGQGCGPTWYWEGVLQSSKDNPWSSSMSFDYPMLYLLGGVSVTGAPTPIYGGSVPTSVPVVGGRNWIFPSSNGGFDPSNLNIFLAGGASWIIPSTCPFYAYTFGFTIPCASAVTLPSTNSIWVYIWQMRGPYGQYTVLSGNEIDCLGGPANKGRCYSLPGDPDNGWLPFWENMGKGIDKEWAMALFVCDVVTVPVNVPGAVNQANPFSTYGFDVGVATLMPNLSSNGLQFGFMTQDESGLGGSRVVLGAFATLFGGGTTGPYGKNACRIPHGWDVLTNLMLGMGVVFLHVPMQGYPAAMYGTTVGAHSAFLPFRADPALFGLEFRFCTFATGQSRPPSASYMITMF